MCKQITLGRIKIDEGQEFKAVPSSLINDTTEDIKNTLFDPYYKE